MLETILRLLGYQKSTSINYEENTQTIKGWIATRHEPAWPDSFDTSRFYPKHTGPAALWEKGGWVWQEVEMKVRLIKNS